MTAQKIEGITDTGNNLTNTCARSKRVSDTCHIESVSKRSLRQKTEGILAAHLPITTMDKDKKRSVLFSTTKVIDTFPRIHAIMQIHGILELL